MKITKQEYYTMKRWGNANEPDGILYYIDEIDGCNFPFQLYIPFELNDKPDLVVANRTPRSDKEHNFEKLLENTAYCFDKDGNKLCPVGPNPVGRLLSYNLGNICLMPIISRPNGIDAPYLGRSVYKNDFTRAYKAIDDGKSGITKEDVLKFKDVHLQVVQMIKSTIEFLKLQNINVDEKVIMTGFSSAAKFSMFFTALHPDMIKAVVAGGTGGNNIIPDKKLDLPYPLGVSDIDNFDENTFKEIPQFYFIGDNDYNDLTKFLTHYEEFPKEEQFEKGHYVRDVSGNTIPKRNDGKKSYHEEVRDDKIVYIQEKIPFDKLDFELDENGDYQLAYDDGNYTLDQVKYINENIGHDVQERWEFMKNYYHDNNINTEFHKYPGDHQTVFDNQELYEDIEKFYYSLNKVKK